MGKSTANVTLPKASHGIRKANITNLNKYIDDTLVSVRRVDGRLHNAAYACVERVGQNGDVRPLQRLVNGIKGKESSVKKNALITYFIQVGCMMLNEETNELELDTDKMVGDNKYDVDLESAWTKPFWTYKSLEGTNKPFVLDDKINNLVKSVARRMADPQSEDKLPKEKVSAIKILNPSLYKETYEQAVAKLNKAA